ncbi:MAG: zf-HC2 domain-containing protein [Candidatus Dadabacteria bacterium]|nr:zf-HC2 domain-containing protein [Candidatus Dadabacteria bacterium]
MSKSIRSLLFKIPYMLNCREFEEFIDDYIDGKLLSSVSRKVYLHLLACWDCKSYIRAYKRSIEMSKAFCDKLDSEVLEDVPDELISIVLKNTK